jgi:hypothetical protein
LPKYDLLIEIILLFIEDMIYEESIWNTATVYNPGISAPQ